METRQLLETITKLIEHEITITKLIEQELTLTPQVVRNIFNVITLDDVELEEDEDLVIDTIKTMYNEYKIYGLTYESGYIIPQGDYQNYLQDVANEFTQCLPDGLDDFFNTNELQQYLISQNKDVVNSYLESCVEFINKNKDESYYTYIKIDSGDYEGTGYVLVEEK